MVSIFDLWWSTFDQFSKDLTELLIVVLQEVKHVTLLHIQRLDMSVNGRIDLFLGLTIHLHLDRYLSEKEEVKPLITEMVEVTIASIQLLLKVVVEV